VWYISYTYTKINSKTGLWLYGDRIVDVHPIEWLMETRQNPEKCCNMRYVILFWSEIDKSDKYKEIFMGINLSENT
jgi:hypothetical protein